MAGSDDTAEVMLPTAAGHIALHSILVFSPAGAAYQAVPSL